VHRAPPAPALRRRSVMSTAVAVTSAATAAAGMAGGGVMLTARDSATSATDATAMLQWRSGSGAMGVASVQPEADGLAQLNTAALVKAAGLAPQQAAAAEADTASACPPNRAGFGAVKPWVANAGYFLRCKFDVSTVIGVAGRGGVSDHPIGLALDFMVDRSAGDALASCALRNQDRMGITYVIWQQRINYGNGWEPMEDRGDATANHMDHVHISFAPRPGSGAPQCGPTSA
jgi:hypothetical protein